MRAVSRYLVGWALVTAIGFAVLQGSMRLPPGQMPAQDAQQWSLAALEAARTGEPVPAAPASASFRAIGPLIVMAWYRGAPLGRVAHDGTLAEAVGAAIDAFAADEQVTGVAGWRAPSGDPARVRFTVVVTQGEGPLVRGIPYLENLSIVPLHEGLVARIDGRVVWITPDELLAAGQYDGGVPLPIPDTSLGAPIDLLLDRMARDLGVEPSELLARGEVRRFRATSITETPWPREREVTEEEVRQAAVDGARMLLRNQRRDGQLTYIFDARRGTRINLGYNLPRHSGATYFLAQVHHLVGMPEARDGALRALRWLNRAAVRRCGGEDRWCVSFGGNADVGSAALATVAASEILATGDDPLARQMVIHLTAFLRAQQRSDGELMHEFDLVRQEPIDVQYMYYSGEAALAFLTAHRVLGDERNLQAARRVMRHLTGESWEFLGSRYYYGEEHWTCISGGEAGDRIDASLALDFCMRWARWNLHIQLHEGQTPYRVRGGYGMAPGLIVPRLTPVGSRSEAFISTYVMARRAGIDATAPRTLVTEGLGNLLRWRLAPGPVHVMADPVGAYGGLPGSPVDLDVRNDFVQHGGSALLRWAEVLRREREGLDL